jgi:predicted MFS family arabinose efflux permease
MPPPTARRSLNWLNFFMAAVQTGFGPFITVYLTQRGWSQTDIGVTLSIGTAAGMLCQLPAGMLVDSVNHKRGVTAAALVLLGLSALLLIAWPTRYAVGASQILHAAASGILVPAVAALTLALCGHNAFSTQLGVNARYASLGNAAAAGLLGIVASFLSNGAVFALTAALVIPALLALWTIRPQHAADPSDDHPSMQHPRILRQRPERPWHIFRVKHLHVFAVSTALFSLSNAAMLPLALNAMTQRSGAPGLVVSAAIVVPQIVAALISPWIGGAAQRFGRRPVLLAGFLALPLRGLLLATQPAALPLAIMQVLDGISAAVLGIMVPLIAADVTRRTGFLNLAISSLGLAANIGATFSTTLGGLVADRFGISAALLGLAMIGFAATCLVWAALPETRPTRQAKARSSPQPASARTDPLLP